MDHRKRSRADVSSDCQTPSAPHHISSTHQPLIDSDLSSRSPLDHQPCIEYNRRSLAHPLAVQSATLQSTPRSRSSQQWTTSRLGPLLALTLAIALLALAQPAHCAPIVSSIGPAAAAAEAEAHSAERSEEALEQSAPYGSAQAANIAGVSLPSPTGAAQGAAQGSEGLTVDELVLYNRHVNGPYHQRGGRKARSAQHRCNTTMAEYGTDVDRFLEVRQNSARTVGFEPAVNVEIYSMHHLLHMGRKLRAEDDPLSDLPELAYRFRELSRRHHENGDEEPRHGHVNHGVVAVYGLLARRFLCLDSQGETYTVPVRPTDGQLRFNAECLFIRVVGRKACGRETSCSGDSHDCEDMTVFMSYQHPTPYTPRDDGAYVNCSAFENDRNALRKGELISHETASHLLLGDGERNIERWILHSADRRGRDNTRTRDEESSNDSNVVGRPLKDRATFENWDAVGWRVDECTTTETTAVPHSSTPQSEPDVGRWSSGRESPERPRLTPRPTPLPPTTRTTPQTTTKTTTTATTTATTIATTTTPATTTRSPEAQRNFERQNGRGAIREHKIVLASLEPCKMPGGRFYRANCVTKVIMPFRKQPRRKPWQLPSRTTAAPTRT